MERVTIEATSPKCSGGVNAPCQKLRRIEIIEKILREHGDDPAFKPLIKRLSSELVVLNKEWTVCEHTWDLL